ncbi:hypothetical protein F2Q69_00027475 [Brassica cretica]|uniref:Uncharacterized protein n=1 Tax=Brassica cretica TaxID=69181 RepID=A0A8S9SAF4_BRACR|nr:hypothetical protein F2Q69_00027475 [Brassica cretica]
MMQVKLHGQDMLERADTSSVGSGTRAVLRERELAEIVYRTREGRELSFGNGSWLRSSIGQEKAASCSCLDQDVNRLKLISGTLAVQADIAVIWN